MAGLRKYERAKSCNNNESKKQCNSYCKNPVDFFPDKKINNGVK